jgi:hypothetical protein
MAKPKPNRSQTGAIKRALQNGDAGVDTRLAGKPPAKAQRVTTGCSKADTKGKGREDAKEPRVKAKAKVAIKPGKNSNRATGCGEDDVCNVQEGDAGKPIESEELDNQKCTDTVFDAFFDPDHPEIGLAGTPIESEELDNQKCTDTVFDAFFDPDHPEIGLAGTPIESEELDNQECTDTVFDAFSDPDHPEIGLTNEAHQTPKVLHTVNTIDTVPEPEHPEIGHTNHVTEDTAGSEQGQTVNETESDEGYVCFPARCAINCVYVFLHYLDLLPPPCQTQSFHAGQ